MLSQSSGEHRSPGMVVLGRELRRQYETQQLLTPVRGSLYPLIRFTRQKPLGAISAAILIALAVLAAFAPALARYSPTEPNQQVALRPPGGDHLLGTDHLGRDLLARLVYGARISLAVSVGAVALGTTFASLIGVTSGYFGGIFDLLVQRAVDAFMAFPWLVILLSLMSVIGTGILQVIVVLGLFMTFGNSRIIRSAVFAVKESAYVECAVAVGCGHGRIIWRHILPNIGAPLIVIASVSLGWAVLSEAALSFLGFGIPPPEPTWGGELSWTGRDYLRAAPWIALFPGIALSLTVFSFNMLGDALRDVLDPRLRGIQSRSV